LGGGRPGSGAGRFRFWAGGPVDAGELSTGDYPRLSRERNFFSGVRFLCAEPGAFACFYPALWEGPNEEAGRRFMEVLCKGSAIDRRHIAGVGVLVEGHGQGGNECRGHPGQLGFVCWVHLQPSPRLLNPSE